MAISQLPKDLFDKVSVDTTIIDTGNYYPGSRDSNIQEIDDGEVESVWVSRQIGRPIIKAFNDIAMFSLAEASCPKGTKGRLALAVSGDNTKQKEMVMKLIDEDIGFDPVDAGSLAESWRKQPCTPAYCCDWDAETMREKLAEAVPGEARPKLKIWFKKVTELGFMDISREQAIALNRSLHN